MPHRGDDQRQRRWIFIAGTGGQGKKD